MFNSRKMNIESFDIHYNVPMKQYSAQCIDIPLKKNWSDSWCALPETFDHCLDKILQFEVRPRDVFVVTFMKCGTTWMQEAAWLLLNDLNFEKSKEKRILERSPFLDFIGLLPPGSGLELDPLKLTEQLHDPRLIKSHMPANLLPSQIWQKKQKTIYVARNVKDVIVSSFHFAQHGMWKGDSILDYVNNFINDEIHWTPFWTHIIDFWKMRNESFIFFVTYEEMIKDLPGVVRRLCQFLNKSTLTDDQLNRLVAHLSFGKMKDNRQANLTEMMKETFPDVPENFQFMRRGIVGSYRDELTPEVQAKIDSWTASILSKHGLTEKDIFGEL
uniref:Sulfotransferase domain-containing protein n=1 Tax=Glossina austeni TaxID=7395 RepID=A0A1A9V4E0_GLOAU